MTMKQALFSMPKNYRFAAIMMKKLHATSLLLAILFVIACQPLHQKTDSGLEYVIIHGSGDGPVATSGSTVKLHYLQKLHDTVTQSTYEKMPYYKALIPGTIFEYDAFEVLGHGVRE